MIPRQRSPVPPLPPKDTSTTTSSSSIHSYSSSRPSSRYINVNQDLADAVRDSVHIKSSPTIDFSSPPILEDNTTTSYSYQQGGGAGGGSKLPKPPSLNPLIPRRTPSPNPPNGDHRLSTANMTLGQPQLPSQRVISSQNPFESDEIEPIGPLGGGTARPGGNDVLGQNGRAKFVRAQTGLNSTTSTSSSANLLHPSSPTKTRVRRSMSSGSYGLDANGRELTAGQKKALEDKKGSRHADVIDTWDPTGLGSAMWHHAGPYDAAAPSRNKDLPNAKAPMRAFNGQVPVKSPPRAPSTISLASPPEPPRKDSQEGMKRVGAPIKSNASRRVSGGGLTGTYSTSMPASGGYFPDMNEPTDDAEVARRERQKEREQKRRALKAAWGIDNPEPFEDFGGTPGTEGDVDLTDDIYSPESGTTPLPGTNRPMRSPGLRLAGGGGTPPIYEDSTSPMYENAPRHGHGHGHHGGSAGAGGVKRTKSLMQKIKTMVRTRSGSVEGGTHQPMVQPSQPAVGAGQRSHSMSGALHHPAVSPGWMDRDVVEEEEVVDDENQRNRNDDDRFEDATEDVFGVKEKAIPVSQQGYGSLRR